MDGHLRPLRSLPCSNQAAKLPQIPPPSKPQLCKAGVRIAAQPHKSLLISSSVPSLLGLSSAPCCAAAGVLPWDQPLVALQNVLTDSVAPAAIGLAFAGAVILHALGGHNEQARRLFESGIGGCIALGVVHLLNYVLP